MEAEASSSSDGSSVVVKTELLPVTPYEVNSMVLCSHTDNLFYEAKIIAVEPQPSGDFIYTVHYQGWSKRYDEKIPHSIIASRFRPFTPENIVLAKHEIKEAKARAAVSTKRKKVHRSETRRGRPPLRVSECSSSSKAVSNVKRDMLRRVKLPANGNVSRDSFREILSQSPSTSEVISFPEKLRVFLINDYQLVGTELKLPLLPSRASVSKILREYASYVRKLDAVCSEVKVYKGRARYWKAVVAALDECTDNVENYFDLTIEDDILYPNEKLRHKELTVGATKVIRKPSITDDPDKPVEGIRASEYYGFIYLLRFLTKFQEMIEFMPCDDDSKQTLIVFNQSFIGFLGSNSEKFFDPERDYQLVTADYRQRLQSNEL